MNEKIRKADAEARFKFFLIDESGQRIEFLMTMGALRDVIKEGLKLLRKTMPDGRIQLRIVE